VSEDLIVLFVWAWVIQIKVVMFLIRVDVWTSEVEERVLQVLTAKRAS
jgi:hypothetical protein